MYVTTVNLYPEIEPTALKNIITPKKQMFTHNNVFTALAKAWPGLQAKLVELFY
jgi:hypothetical protein